MRNLFKRDREETISNHATNIVKSILLSHHEYNQEEQNKILIQVISEIKHKKELRKQTIENEIEHIEILIRNFPFNV